MHYTESDLDLETLNSHGWDAGNFAMAYLNDCGIEAALLHSCQDHAQEMREWTRAQWIAWMAGFTVGYCSSLELHEVFTDDEAGLAAGMAWCIAHDIEPNRDDWEKDFETIGGSSPEPVLEDLCAGPMEHLGIGRFPDEVPA